MSNKSNRINVSQKVIAVFGFLLITASYALACFSDREKVYIDEEKCGAGYPQNSCNNYARWEERLYACIIEKDEEGNKVFTGFICDHREITLLKEKFKDGNCQSTLCAGGFPDGFVYIENYQTVCDGLTGEAFYNCAMYHDTHTTHPLEEVSESDCAEEG